MDIEEKYKFRFNPKSNRLQNYDYSSNGAYFITICTKDRQHYFGEVVDGKMILCSIGIELKREIENIPIFRKNVALDSFIIMPDHIHMVLFLKNEFGCEEKMFHRNISTKSGNNSEKFSKEYYSNISPNKDSLGNIIKLFKSFFTKNINSKLEKIFFAWQDNYYERIIRDDKELFKIRLYIENNPKKWEIDKKQNIGIFM